MKWIAALMIEMASVAAFAAAPRTSLDELRALQLNKAAITLVDVRTPDDFLKGHIQGAKNAPRGEMGTDLRSVNVRIVVYCTEDPCPTSDSAAEKLTGMGHAVSILAGGFVGWKEKGYPIVVDKAVMTLPGRLPITVVLGRLGKADLSVLDIRAVEEYRAGHLKGAVNVPLEILKVEQLGLSKERDVLIYDRTATRVRLAAQILMAAGYRTYEMPGGVAGWIKKGYPLEMK